MEMILGLIIIGGLWYAYKVTTETKKSSNMSDAAPYKVEPSTTTKIDGIGHEAIPVQKPTANVEVVETVNILDVNNDGKVNIEDAKAAVSKVVKKVKAVADVNKDGKVNKADVAKAAKNVKQAVKKAAPAKKAKKPAK